MDYESLRKEINAADEAMLQLMLKRLALEEAALGENRSPAEKSSPERRIILPVSAKTPAITLMKSAGHWMR